MIYGFKIVKISGFTNAHPEGNMSTRKLRYFLNLILPNSLKESIIIFCIFDPNNKK